MTEAGPQTTDALFRHIEAVHAGRPWGRVLDAGTGAHSLAWVASLPTESWTAVTADEAMRATVLGAVKGRAQDRVLVGNWTDPVLLHGERFDVVLADYLLGAVDGFAPYFQEQLFDRIRSVLGGRLYVVGLEPWPDRALDPGAALVLEITRLRDACILLAGDRCYREYPRVWTERQLARAGFVVIDAVSVPILVRERFVDGQLDVCVRKLRRIEPPALRHSLHSAIDALRRRAHERLRSGPIPFGHDWVITAELR